MLLIATVIVAYLSEAFVGSIEVLQESGTIQISDDTRRLIEESFVCEPRGEIELKGRGALHTWYIVGRR